MSNETNHFNFVNDLRVIDNRLIEKAKEMREILEEREIVASIIEKKNDMHQISHDLRTPLNAIIGFSEILLSMNYGNVNEKQAEFLELIHSSGLDLLDVVTDILENHES